MTRYGADGDPLWVTLGMEDRRFAERGVEAISIMQVIPSWRPRGYGEHDQGFVGRPGKPRTDW
jgi:hypothetical protein